MVLDDNDKSMRSVATNALNSSAQKKNIFFAPFSNIFKKLVKQISDSSSEGVSAP